MESGLSRLFVAMLVADGSGGCVLSSLWLLLLEDLLHVAILCHARDDYKLINNYREPSKPEKKNILLKSQYEKWVAGVGRRIHFFPSYLPKTQI